MEVSILIASNGGAAQALRCLESLADTVPESVLFEVVFVDNGARDGTHDALRGIEGDFVLVHNEDDRGLASAVGQAAERAVGDIVILMSPEVVAEAGWLEPLVAALKRDPTVHCVRPDVVAPDPELRPQSCLAVRRMSVVEALARHRISVTDVDHERVGQALLAMEEGAHLERRSVVRREPAPPNGSSHDSPKLVFPELADVAGFDSFLGALKRDRTTVLPDAVESSPLAACLMDGSRTAGERAVAGTILSASTSSEAFAATTRRLVSVIDDEERRRIASLLEPHGWGPTWERLTAARSPGPDELFWWGIETRNPEYDQVVADLQLLNDVLATSALAGRWWIFSGMLLGWAREGALFRRDLHDFDFAFSGVDLDRFRVAMVNLMTAGFLPRYRYPGVLERCTAFTLVRHGTKFEFYVMEADGPDHYRHHSYGHFNGITVQNNHRSRTAVPSTDRLPRSAVAEA